MWLKAAFRELPLPPIGCCVYDNINAKVLIKHVINSNISRVKILPFDLRWCEVRKDWVTDVYKQFILLLAIMRAGY